MSRYSNSILSILGRCKRDERGCLIWTGYRSTPGRHGGGGYGVVWYRGKQYHVHKLLYERLVGSIPDGYELHHECNRGADGCVDLAHLTPLTKKEHNLCGNSPMARQARQTHCIHGHPLEGPNLYINPSGKRQCRTCKRRRDSKYNQPVAGDKSETTQKRRWARGEDHQLHQMFAIGCSDWKIAADLDRTVASIQQRRRLFNLGRHSPLSMKATVKEE